MSEQEPNDGDNATTEPTSPSLLSRLVHLFGRWSPRPPALERRGCREVALVFSPGPWAFARPLFVLQRKEKIPPWVTVYSGGKSRVTVRPLAPAHPHRFRLRAVIRASTVRRLAELAAAHYGSEDAVEDEIDKIEKEIAEDEGNSEESEVSSPRRWLQSRWSAQTWCSTDSEGTSAACFCMAVRCGYLVQVQQMLEERPELVAVVNSSSGLTPLATAARRGDTSMVRLLLAAGAEADQRCAGARTALHAAAAHGHVAAVELLLASGADFTCRDVNGLRVEHFAVESGAPAAVRALLARGDPRVIDGNGWTPLFRAVVQGASAALVRELLQQGSELEVVDRRGLTLAAAARLLQTRHGRRRESILRLVDSSYQHERALASFARASKKITSIQLLARK